MNDSYENVLAKLNDEEITFFQFLEEVNCGKQFKKWCADHYLVPDEGAAQLFFDHHGFEDMAQVKEFVEPLS